MKISDRSVGIAGILMSAFLLSTIWTTQFETKAFPMAGLFILMILSVILALRREDKKYTLENFKQVAMGIGLLLFYIAGLKVLGFILASILFLFAFVSLNHYEGSKIVAAFYCVALPILLFAIFQLLFHIRLPQGIL